MILSWHLWQALCHPPHHHPLYQQMLTVRAAISGVEFMLPVLRLMVFYALHEVIIVSTWRVLAHWLNTNINELNHLVRSGQ